MVQTITSNEQDVRLRIFEGDLDIRDAAAELIRIGHCQIVAERRRSDDYNKRIIGCLRDLLEYARGLEEEIAELRGAK